MTSFFLFVALSWDFFCCECSLLSHSKWKNWMQNFSHFIWIVCERKTFLLLQLCCRCVCVSAHKRTHAHTTIFIKSNEFDFYSQTNLFPLHLILWITLSANNRAAKWLTNRRAYSFCVIFTNWSRSHHITSHHSRKFESLKSCEHFATIGNTAIKHIALERNNTWSSICVSLFTRWFFFFARCFIKIHLRKKPNHIRTWASD